MTGSRSQTGHGHARSCGRLVLACCDGGLFPKLEQIDIPARSELPLGELTVLTILAIIAGPILVTTIVTIFVFEIKAVWDRNRLR